MVRSIAKPASAAASFTVSSPATACRDDAAFVATSQPGATTAIAGYSALDESHSLSLVLLVFSSVGAPGTPSVYPASAPRALEASAKTAERIAYADVLVIAMLRL